MQLTQALQRAAQVAADDPALIFGEMRVTWRAVLNRVARLAGGLRQLGVKPGDRLALLADSSPHYFETVYAALWCGAIAVPLNTRLAGAELAAVANDAEPRVVLTDRVHAAAALQLAKECGSICSVVLAGSEAQSAEMIDFDTLLGDPIGDHGCGGDDVAALYYTGGTTGLPKGVMITHWNLYANSMNAIASAGLDQSAVHLHCGPWFHLAAAARLFAVTIVAGRHVILPRFNAQEVLATIEREKVSVATFVPTMIGMLLNHPKFQETDLSLLRFVSYGGAPMPEALIIEAMERLTHVGFGQSYGMTELSPVATFLGALDHREGLRERRLLSSVGRAIPGASIKIVNDRGENQPTGATGEILVKGPMVMKGYWRRPEATREVIREGWMHTGDVGHLDPKGYLFVEDRIKDMIVTGGENVYTVEVENALYLHEAVAQCAVIGIPHPVWGEAVHAVVHLKAGRSADEDDLCQHCRHLIAGYKVPKSIEFRPEPLPLSGVGKIHKAVIRAPYWSEIRG